MPIVRAAALVLVAAAALAIAGPLRRAPRDAPGAAGDDAAGLLERLRALGYAEWAELPEDGAARTGVVRDAPGLSFPGVVFYHSRSRSEAHLLGADGHALHGWRTPGSAGWHHVELLDDGDLLVVRRDGVLARLDWRSRPRWERALDAHHDVAASGGGRIHVLTHALGAMPFAGQRVPVVEDFVTTLSEDGRVLRRISLLDLLADRVPRARLAAIAALPERELLERDRPHHGLADVLHTNTVEELERDVPGLGRRGDLLLGVRELDLVAVVDPRARRVVWSFGPGELDRPHQPTLLGSGRVLVFDNGPSRGRSRVVEVDPRRNEIVWEYAAPPGERFYSEKMGGCQGLPNGNVLVTESAAGRAFEVTRDGRVAWEFLNPELDAKRRRRASIHRLSKLDPARVERMFRRHGELLPGAGP